MKRPSARGDQRTGLPRPRLLGQRRVRAAVPRGDAPCRRARHARVPRPSAAGGQACGSEARAFGCSLPVGVRTDRRRRHSSIIPATMRADGGASSTCSPRSTSPRTLPGPRRRTSRGPAIVPSHGGKASSFSSRPPATGRQGSRPGPTTRGHIRRVIGPDEYHEGVDDNAFTNGWCAGTCGERPRELPPHDDERLHGARWHDG